MRVNIKGRVSELSDILGEGGEARVFRHNGQAVKIWKPANDPTIPDAERKAVAKKLLLAPAKLAAFPNFQFSNVIVPTSPVHDEAGKIVIGYTMPLVNEITVPIRKWSERSYALNLDWQVMRRGLMDLWYAVKNLHGSGIVWGDANDLNVLMTGSGTPYIIDCDSFQYGKFQCTAFTQRFGDWRLMDRGDLVKPHDEGSDWYAWAIMVYQCLTGIGPWDGTPQLNRPGKVGCWDASIRIPKWATPHANLDEGMKYALETMFLTHCRTPPSPDVLPPTRRDCSKCGRWVWGPTCACGLTERSTTVSGDVYHQGVGKIVDAWVLADTIHFVEKRGSAYYDALNAKVPFGQPREPLTDRYDSTYQECYINNKSVNLRNGGVWQVGYRLGSVVNGKSRIFGGPTFGVGISRLLDSWLPFIIDGGINDSLKLAPITGRVYDAFGYTSTTHGWLGLDNGQDKRLLGFTRSGVGTFDTIVPSVAGGVAYDRFLFIPHDGYLMRYAPDGTKRFDNVPITSNHKLLLTTRGLFAWDENEIRSIKVS